MAAKCPKCDKIVGSVNMETLEINQNYQSRWHGVVYTCPFCSSLLSVGMDPTLLRNETVDGVLQGLRR